MGLSRPILVPACVTAGEQLSQELQIPLIPAPILLFYNHRR